MQWQDDYFIHNIKYGNINNIIITIEENVCRNKFSLNSTKKMKQLTVCCHKGLCKKYICQIMKVLYVVVGLLSVDLKELETGGLVRFA